MELLQLQYFRELARSGHLSRTAEKLYISQPSLSQMLKRLETELGMPLFNRVGKRIVLNDSGKIFLKYVEDVFSALDNAAADMEKNHVKNQETVALYIRSASMFLPEIVRQIQVTDANIRLRIFHYYIMEGKPEYPALYLSSSPTCKIEDECSEILLKEEIKAALPKSHPLADKQQISWEDLEGEPFLSLSPESDLYEAVHYFCSAKGIEPNITTYVDTPDILRELIKLNLGIAFVPELTWRGFAEDTVVLKTVHDLEMERYLLISWNQKISQTPAWKICRDTIKNVFIKSNLQVRPAKEV